MYSHKSLMCEKIFLINKWEVYHNTLRTETSDFRYCSLMHIN